MLAHTAEGFAPEEPTGRISRQFQHRFLPDCVPVARATSLFLVRHADCLIGGEEA